MILARLEQLLEGVCDMTHPKVKVVMEEMAQVRQLTDHWDADLKVYKLLCKSYNKYSWNNFPYIIFSICLGLNKYSQVIPVDSDTNTASELSRYSAVEETFGTRCCLLPWILTKLQGCTSRVSNQWRLKGLDGLLIDWYSYDAIVCSSWMDVITSAKSTDVTSPVHWLQEIVD